MMPAQGALRRRASAPLAAALLMMLVLAQGCALLRPEQPTPELRRMAGQMLLIGFRGAEPYDAAEKPLPILAQISELNLGGVILFDRDAILGNGRNIQSPAQLARLTSAISRAAAQADMPPLFIAVDQEGGRVQRLKPINGFPATPAAARLCPDDDDAPAFDAGRSIGRTLREAGVNLDFAPVCDVNVNPQNPVIGALDRSFSADPVRAAACAAAFARGLKSQGILTAAKHFPGHGSSNADSHLGFTDVTQTWSEAELGPFAALIRQHLADMVMTAHVYNSRLDGKDPATLSRPVITGVLRGRLGYKGVVVTDDMQMRAVSGKYGFKEALGRAVNAGADILLIGDNLEYDVQIGPKALDDLMELVAEGVVPAARIRESYARIMDLKQRGLATAGAL